MSAALKLALGAHEAAGEAMGARDEAIRQVHRDGASIRAIAEALGLSSARIHQILHSR